MQNLRKHIPFAPHNPSGPVANAATLQLAACCPNFAILEIMYADVEYRKDIRVNAVLLGMIKNDRWNKNPEFYNSVLSRYTPIGDVATGRDVEEAAYYFTAHAKNTTGAELVVDGGNMIQLYPIIPKQ